MLYTTDLFSVIHAFQTLIFNNVIVISEELSVETGDGLGIVKNP